jgi:hypothetical protein
MTGHAQAVKSWLGQVLEGSAGAHGSLAYRTNRKAIWRGDIPEKYTRLVDLVPGKRVLELGAAEGVLSLLLAQKKEKVFALDGTRKLGASNRPGRSAGSMSEAARWCSATSKNSFTC